jgi:hypothetical protein
VKSVLREKKRGGSPIQSAAPAYQNATLSLSFGTVGRRPGAKFVFFSMLAYVADGYFSDAVTGGAGRFFVLCQGAAIDLYGSLHGGNAPATLAGRTLRCLSHSS